MSLSVGETTLSALPQNDIRVLNDSGSGTVVDIWAASSFLDNGALHSEMSLALISSGAGAIQTDALGEPAFPVPWNSGFIFYELQDRSDPDFRNWKVLAISQVQLNNLTVTTVPLPPTWLLLTTGLVALARSRLKGRQARPANSRIVLNNLG
ncbi:MAG: hypothetical protein ABI567_02005 [Gammaproteobacteria bacterium]